MNIKSISVLLLSGAYFFVCHYLYCCKVKAACYGCAVDKVAVVSPIAVNTKPLSFEWSKATPLLGIGFDEEAKKWLAENTGDNLLEITGHYAKEEAIPKKHENMGLARAAIVRALLLTELPEERIRISSHLIEVSDTSNFISNNIITTKWLKLEETGSDVLQLDKKAVILFPKNSIKKETNKATDEYLRSIAERVQTTGEVIHLTGHTDNEGNEAANLKLAKKRAMRIRRILRQKGVSRDQIVVESKGEADPVATNETENGRYLNRRVVLTLVKE